METIDSRENLIRLINQYQNLIFSICLKMTADYFTAEDITQDTFVAAFEHMKTFDGGNEKAWLCRIATNKCLDYQKAAARKVMAVGEEEFFELPADSEPLREMLNEELMDDFRKVIEKLDEPYKSVSRKHFLEGKTAAEIAKETDIGLKTIQTQLYRARGMLKKYIRKEDLLT